MQVAGSTGPRGGGGIAASTGGVTRHTTKSATFAQVMVAHERVNSIMNREKVRSEEARPAAVDGGAAATSAMRARERGGATSYRERSTGRVGVMVRTAGAPRWAVATCT